MTEATIPFDCHAEHGEESNRMSAGGNRTGFFAALSMTCLAVIAFFTHLPARALLAFIRVYQRVVSPALPALFGSTCGCRFTPTCSHYAAGAVREHGAITGVWLAARRLVKCTPFHAGGFDPVPARRATPRCVRATA